MKINTGSRSRAGRLAALLLACWFLPGLGPGRVLSLGVGVCQAEEPAVVLQIISSRSEEGTLKVFQGISGLHIVASAITDNMSLNLSNSSLYGVMNVNEASGGFGINQASVFNCDATVNVPGLVMPAMTTTVTSVLKDNAVHLTGTTNYSTAITGQGFAGAGVLMLNQTAGNVNNSFTSVGVSVGPLLSTPPNSPVITGLNGAVALSNGQLQAYAATNNNHLTTTGKQIATATIDGAPFTNFTGVAAITQVTGNLNQVTNSVQVNVNR
jgi:hypothetical protein